MTDVRIVSIKGLDSSKLYYKEELCLPRARVPVKYASSDEKLLSQNSTTKSMNLKKRA